MRSVILPLVLLGTAFSVACTSGTAVAPALPAPHEWDTEAAPKLSAQVVVDIYLDTSQSMRGFLVDKQPNHFRDVLNRSQDILTVAWDKADVHGWRFGNLGKSAPLGSSLREFAQRPVLFSDLETHIDEAIRSEGTKSKDHASPLKIVITDLFQNGGDVGRLANELNERYMRNADNAVGILGIRNVFDGPITDIPKKLDAGQADSLPFYLIVAGRGIDVEHAVTRLKDRLQLSVSDSTFTLFFTRRVVRTLSRPLVALATSPNSGFSPKVLAPGAEQRGIPQVQVAANTQAQIRLQPRGHRGTKFDSLSVFPDMDRYPVDTEAEVRKLVKAWGGTKKGDPDEAAAMSFDIDLNTGVLTVEPGHLAAKTAYLLQLDVFAKPRSLKYASWSLDESTPITNDMFVQKDGSRPGRTLNLEHFLQTLSDRLFQSEIPLARYHLYATRQ